MQPDMTRQLQQLQRQAAELGQLARDLAAATPQRSAGSDGTGWVHLALGPDGLPTEIRVRDGWRQHLEPERLGAAVLDANRDAVQRAMQAWTDNLDDSRWWNRRADLDDTTDEETTPAGRDLSEPPQGRVRDTNDLAEQVLTALHQAQQPPVRPATPEGADDGRNVIVQIGPGGLTGCEIDPNWATRRDGVAVTAALSVALHRAVAAQRPATTSPRADTDSLVGDALATLAFLTTPPTTEGDDR